MIDDNQTIDEVNETGIKSFGIRKVLFISGSDTLVTKLPCVRLHSNGKQHRMVKYRSRCLLRLTYLHALHFFHEIRFNDGWSHVTIDFREASKRSNRKEECIQDVLFFLRIRDEFRQRIPIIRTNPIIPFTNELSLAKAFSYLRNAWKSFFECYSSKFRFNRKLLKILGSITRIRLLFGRRKKKERIGMNRNIDGKIVARLK